MSAMGKAWHWQGVEGRDPNAPFLRAAVELTGESSPLSRVRWWANVLYESAEYKPHKHDGKWAFVYHLTEGAAVHFNEPEGPIGFNAVPGQILVFDAKLSHWTSPVEGDTPRVSIAGNLHFR